MAVSGQLCLTDARSPHDGKAYGAVLACTALRGWVHSQNIFGVSEYKYYADMQEATAASGSAVCANKGVRHCVRFKKGAREKMHTGGC